MCAAASGRCARARCCCRPRRSRVCACTVRRIERSTRLHLRIMQMKDSTHLACLARTALCRCGLSVCDITLRITQISHPCITQHLSQVLLRGMQAMLTSNGNDSPSPCIILGYGRALGSMFIACNCDSGFCVYHAQVRRRPRQRLGTSWARASAPCGRSWRWRPSRARPPPGSSCRRCAPGTMVLHLYMYTIGGPLL